MSMEGEMTFARPLRLLLVDDEQGFTRVMAKRLSKRNVQATTAASGTEALRILRGQDFDAAVVDLKMEDMDGIEVLKIFKRMVPEMPVVILTGHGSELSAQEAMEAGAKGWLTKPYEIDELVAILASCVEIPGGSHG